MTDPRGRRGRLRLRLVILQRSLRHDHQGLRDVSRFDTLTTEGSFADGFLASYGNDGRLVGALTVGQSEDLETLVKELIAEGAPATALEPELVGT